MNDMINERDKEFANEFSRFVNGKMCSASKVGGEFANDHIHKLFKRLADAAVGQLPPPAAADCQNAVPVTHKGGKRKLAAEHLRQLGGKGVHLAHGRVLFKDHFPHRRW